MGAPSRAIPLTEATMSPDRLLPEETTSHLPEMGQWGASLGKMQSELRRKFWSAYERTMDASESFIDGVQERGRTLKEKRPMMLLGIIAGMAFAAGVGIAAWRARES
jgi:hypothetical protein